MNFTTKDIKLLKETYNNFLNNLAIYVNNTMNNNIEEHFSLISYLFRNGYLTIEQNMELNSEFKSYLHISSELSEGIQVMIGKCCCRHANYFLNDILKLLGYYPKMLYVYIAENGDWHLKKNGCNSNHVAVSLESDEEKLILDLYNNFIIVLDKEGNIKSTNTNFNTHNIEPPKQFNDKTNIKIISKTLKKYYTLKKLGIKHVYEDEQF